MALQRDLGMADVRFTREVTRRIVSVTLQLVGPGRSYMAWPLFSTFSVNAEEKVLVVYLYPVDGDVRGLLERAVQEGTL